MFDLREELKSGGAYPIGPVSAWPQERHEQLTNKQKELSELPQRHETKTARRPLEGDLASVKAKMPGIGKMASGFVKTAGQAIAHGKVEPEIRDERYNTCKSCPFFVPESKRCSECGCFMEAKTWVGGDPDLLCPKQKWSR